MSKPNIQTSTLTTLGISAALTTTAIQTSAYSAAGNQLIPCDATSAGFIVTLPSAPVDKTKITVKKVDSSTNIITVAAGGSDVFNKSGGVTSLTLSLQNQSVTLQYSTTSSIWYVTGDDLPLTQLNATFAPITSGFAAASGWAVVTDAAWAGGADPTGVVSAVAALNAAITSGKTVFLPSGTYKIDSDIHVVASTRIIGAALDVVTLQLVTGVSAAGILGTSSAAANNIHLENFTIDCGNSSGLQVVGIQLTNASSPFIRRVKITNCAKGAFLLQGSGSGGGCPNFLLDSVTVNGSGLINGSTGHAICISDASSGGRIINPYLQNVVGGMGIAAIGASGTGYPTDCHVIGATITMAASTIGFEAIGIAASCTGWTISDFKIMSSQDNGISATADRTTISAGSIDGTINHGIDLAGYGSVVSGVRVRNVGQGYSSAQYASQNSLAYAAICFEATAARCTVGDITIVDDQGTTLSSGLSTSGAITSLPVAALVGAVVAGQTITVVSGSNTQTFTVGSGGAAIGATAIPIISATPTYAFPTASVVNTPTISYGFKNNAVVSTTAHSIGIFSASGIMLATFNGLVATDKYIDSTGHSNGFVIGPTAYSIRFVQSRISQTLSTSGVVTFDAQTGAIQSCTLAANCTGSTIPNSVLGERMTISFLQNSTGGFTYSWPAINFIKGQAPPNQLAPSVRDTVEIVYNGTTWDEVSRSTTGTVSDRKTVTAAYTVVPANDNVILVNSSSAITVSLPTTGLRDGQQFTIFNETANTVTVGSSVNINGTTGKTLAQYAFVTVLWDASVAQFWIINS